MTYDVWVMFKAGVVERATGAHSACYWCLAARILQEVTEGRMSHFPPLVWPMVRGPKEIH